MGADIYLESVTKAAAEKYQPLFDAAVIKRHSLQGAARDAAQAEVSEAYDKMYPDDGYFRDSYNGSALSAVLGFSWWQDIVPMLQKGYLPISRAKKFRAMLDSKPVTMARVEQIHSERKLQDSVQEWYDHWVDKRKRLIALLDSSIAKKERLLCSL